MIKINPDLLTSMSKEFINVAQKHDYTDVAKLLIQYTITAHFIGRTSGLPFLHLEQLHI